MKPEAVVVDIDGVLSDNEHRKHLYPNHQEEFYSKVLEDLAIEPVVKLVDILFWGMDYSVYLLTSRPEYCREDTIAWLFKNLVSYADLIMRPKDNVDKMWKVKQIKKLRIENHILWIFEDNPIEIALFMEQNWPVIPIRSKNHEGVN